MIVRAPCKKVSSTAFGNEGMDVRIPFKISSKSVKYTNETGSKVFAFIHLKEHTKNNITYGMKKNV